MVFEKLHKTFLTPPSRSRYFGSDPDVQYYLFLSEECHVEKQQSFVLLSDEENLLESY